VARKPTYDKVPGVYEEPKGSNIWHIYWHDAEGQRHREKVGAHDDAVVLKMDREADKLHQRKFPDELKFTTAATFGELCTDAQKFKEHRNGDKAKKNLATIIKVLADDFGKRQASTIPKEEWEEWLREEEDERDWAQGTYNHYVTQIRLIYRIAIEETKPPKATENPTRGMERYKLHDEKPRFLEDDEAERFRVAIAERWPQHWPAFQFARSTGFRATAQFNLKLPDVDMRKKEVTLHPKKNSKYHKKRILPMNAIAYSVLEEMIERSTEFNKAHGTKWVFAEYHDGPKYLSIPAHWFPEIVEAAEVKDLRGTVSGMILLVG